MKYIYFDCYAGFDLQMALGALIDMGENAEYAKSIAQKVVPGAQLFCENVKRQSMDALLALFDLSLAEEVDIKTIPDALDVNDETKFLLKRWLTVKDDGKKHSFHDELKDFVNFVVCAELIKSCEAEKLYISSVSQGSGAIYDGDNINFIPSKHTELLTKMAGIPITEINTPMEILTPSALAFLYVMGAEYMPPGAHDVIKSGYGAGGEALSVPNIARCILAKDSGDADMIGFDCIFSEFSTEFAKL